MLWNEWRACLMFTTSHTCIVTTVHWITKNAEIPGVELNWARVLYSQHHIHALLQLYTELQKILNYLVLQLQFCVVTWLARMFNVYNITYMFCYNSTLNYRNCWTTWNCTERSVCWDKWCACLTFTTWHTCNVTTVNWITKIAELPGITVWVLCGEMSGRRV